MTFAAVAAAAAAAFLVLRGHLPSRLSGDAAGGPCWRGGVGAAGAETGAGTRGRGGDSGGAGVGRVRGGGGGAAGAETGVGFEEGVEVVAGAVAGVDPSVGEFVRMMAARKWVEGRAGDKKAPGAYCTQVAPRRSPPIRARVRRRTRTRTRIRTNARTHARTHAHARTRTRTRTRARTHTHAQAPAYATLPRDAESRPRSSPSRGRRGSTCPPTPAGALPPQAGTRGVPRSILGRLAKLLGQARAGGR